MTLFLADHFTAALTEGRMTDNREVIVDATSIVTNVLNLFEDLRALKADYSGRDKATSTVEQQVFVTKALIYLAEFVRANTLPEEGLEEPVMSVVGGLLSLVDGGERPSIFTSNENPKPGRPKRHLVRRQFEAYPAACVDILMWQPLQWGEDEAARFVATELNQLGYRLDGASIDKDQVLGWRRRVREDQSGSLESRSYSRFLQSRNTVDMPGGQREAVRRVLRFLAGGPYGPVHVSRPTDRQKGE